MPQQRMLVLGGTGLIGRIVVEQALATGIPVRVLTRNATRVAELFGGRAEAVEGDAADATVVRGAVQGCSGVHLSLDGGQDPDLERRAADAVVAAARDLGVQRITMLSGASVCDQNAWFPGTRAKLAAEAAVTSSEIPATVFRSSFFMESLPRFVKGNRASVIGRQPTPWHWVAGKDLAGLVMSAHLDGPGAQLVTLLGPEAMTMTEALQRYCASVNPSAKVGQLPFWAAGLIARMPGGESLAATLPLLKYASHVTEVEQAPVIRGATTLDQWLAISGGATGLEHSPAPVSSDRASRS